MPVLYRLASHPLLSHVQQHVRNVYVYLQDPDLKEMADRFKYFCDNLTLPEGMQRGLQSKGTQHKYTLDDILTEFC